MSVTGGLLRTFHSSRAYCTLLYSMPCFVNFQGDMLKGHCGYTPSHYFINVSICILTPKCIFPQVFGFFDSPDSLMELCAWRCHSGLLVSLFVWFFSLHSPELKIFIIPSLSPPTSSPPSSRLFVFGGVLLPSQLPPWLQPQTMLAYSVPLAFH